MSKKLGTNDDLEVYMCILITFSDICSFFFNKYHSIMPLIFESCSAFSDIYAPTFDSCPSDINLETLPGDATRVVDWNVVATDYSGFVDLTATHNPNDTFTVGTTEVSYTASDPTGNTAYCNFTVTISGIYIMVTNDTARMNE